jgi:hypothetical protein
VRLAFEFRPHLTRGQYHIECYLHDDVGGAHMACFSPAALFGVSETRSCSGIADLEVQAAAEAHADLAMGPIVSLVR